MDLGVRGEKALVVGASEGIGYETARMLAMEGAEVLISSRNAGKLAAAAERIRDATGREVRWYAADITRAYDVARLTDWLRGETRALDMLVASVGRSQRAEFEELSDEGWLANYEFNVLSSVRAIRLGLPFLKRSGNGRIVILGAAGARMPYAQQVVSNVHKAGLIALTKTLAAEFAKYAIRVNSVAPGRTLTGLWTARAAELAAERGVSADEVIRDYAREIPMQRFGRPEEIAAVVAFLASHPSSYMTGQSVLVDGGIARGLL